jgi:hypothetical protein
MGYHIVWVLRKGRWTFSSEYIEKKTSPLWFLMKISCFSSNFSLSIDDLLFPCSLGMALRASLARYPTARMCFSLRQCYETSCRVLRMLGTPQLVPRTPVPRVIYKSKVSFDRSGVPVGKIEQKKKCALRAARYNYFVFFITRNFRRWPVAHID